MHWQTTGIAILTLWLLVATEVVMTTPGVTTKLSPWRPLCICVANGIPVHDWWSYLLGIYASVNLAITASGNGLSPACPSTSHYLNKWYPIVMFTLRNKVHWNVIEKFKKKIVQENAFRNVVCQTAAILFRSVFVNERSLLNDTSSTTDRQAALCAVNNDLWHKTHPKWKPTVSEA